MKFFKLLVFVLTTLQHAQSEIIVNTTCGQVKGGLVRPTPYHSPYIAFKGIPYAEPPIGELRFKNPIPHRGWSGIHDATEHGSACPTNGAMGVTAGGNEDCLFLNVYTTDVLAHRPVMFWIHGGGYLLGSGNTLVYGPSRLVRQHIVVVSINYRLGALGFLSTGDRHAQGNYGLKDAVLALKWVQQNIKNFGGDPTKVTIAGESAGSVSVHHLVMSQMARGLFRHAIMMSGSVFSPFSFQPNPRPKAEHLARILGINFSSTEELVQKLREVHFKDILRVERDITHQDFPVSYRSFDYGVVVEPDDSEEERFLTDTVENILQKGDYRTVPTLAGTMSMEGIINLALYSKPKSFDKFNAHLKYFVPPYFNISSSDADAVNKIGSMLKEAYFDNRKVSNETEEEFANFMTDAAFRFGVDRAVKFMVNKSKDPVYYYEISYDGPLNFLKLAVGKKKLPGACHADDLFYLFRPESIGLTLVYSGIPRNDHAFVISDRVVKLWSNFVKTGNPTPYVDDLITLQWPQYTTMNEEYLEIGYDMNVRNHFDRLKIWYELLEMYKAA